MPPKRKDINFLFDDGEDTVAIIDDEANEDLRLKILEKAFSRRNVDNKLDSDLSFDPGVVSTVMVNGGKSEEVKNSKSNKKMKRNKLEAANEIVSMTNSLLYLLLITVSSFCSLNCSIIASLMFFLL